MLAIVFSNVVLPLPFLPTSPTRSPEFIEKLISSSSLILSLLDRLKLKKRKPLL